jgi:hypothetical protein
VTADVSRIVIQPDALGELILNASAHPILHAWRDGQLQPVICRELLLRYFRLLNRLGIPPRTVRWWGWWLGSPEKVLIVHDPEPMLPLDELCNVLAAANQATAVLRRASQKPQLTEEVGETTIWLTPQALMQKLSLE